MLIPIKEILPGDNPREEFDATAMAELMQSMKHSGLLSPVAVRQLPSGKYKLVFGHRRMIAAERLGWERIECIDVEVTDEKDALIKTSTENVIRENVSLPEQGRVFSALLKKGLTVEQIAIRMGCAKRFVQKAIESFNRIPKKYHDKITFGTRGLVGKSDGTISSTVALAAVEIRKDNKLTDSQVGQLMEWASRNGINVVKMRTAGKMIASGVEPKEAMKQVDYMKNVTILVTLKVATIQKLQKKYEMSIHDILYKYLEANDEFDLLTNRLKKLDAKETPSELDRGKKRKVELRRKSGGG
mgnify:FL=1